jgi:thioesterase domain-containing protein
LPLRAEANPQSKPAAANPAKAATSKSAPAKAALAKSAPVKVKTDTRVYLLRGLLNVFSLGMDTLQERLSLMGFEAEVSNHNGWLTIANKIADDRKRGHTGAVVLIGHSLGADVLFQLTERLESENIPVRLAVFFDPTISHDISKNVDHVLNLYQLNGFGRKVTAPKGYKGELVNMDLSGDASIGHGSIDKASKLHDLVVAKIMKVAVGPAQRKRPIPVKPKPIAATPPPAVAAPTASPPSAPAVPSPQVPRI